jgi:hypothetical protein
MLYHLKEFRGYEVLGTDEAVGTVYDFLFDDLHWIVRYVVVDTGGWLKGRQVLLSPASLDQIDVIDGCVRFGLTKKQVESSPPLETRQPVSRQHEHELAQYYGWPQYWSSRVLQTAAAGPPPVPSHRAGVVKPTLIESAEQPALRSIKEVADYELEDAHGRIGKIDDFVADDYTWEIRYLVADIGTWLSGRYVLLSTHWVQSIDWARARLTMQVTRQQIQTSPEYDPAAPVSRDYENLLHEHYGREKYWIADRNVKAVRIE